ncbi:MAG: hypothetical protein H0T70_05925 [Acidimicrobiia bacterium]|nr:hypothetical protein [Acidimicrobiia bacterium]
MGPLSGFRVVEVARWPGYPGTTPSSGEPRFSESPVTKERFADVFRTRTRSEWYQTAPTFRLGPTPAAVA